MHTDSSDLDGSTASFLLRKLDRWVKGDEISGLLGTPYEVEGAL